ncbi:YcnI family protein [Arthrobacter sp. ISL-48]|uniref:YcnI family copper-binding membrane protein n=1 Tax=Arthrobacter sp. ISL-48 TaxID=2819110 RepID=UPI001BE80510|nr:YcnI family protein [Arthrobacter sp. ISL-48]MBT2533380.1 YcnI family protein [Arthrobacter sp. ISL-48]
MKISLRRALKSAVAATMTAGLLAVGAAAASAHVTVEPSKTSEGGYAKLTFNVPNESPTAKTNRLEVKLPTDTPLASVSVKPIDGWKAEVITTALPTPVQVRGATVTKAPTSVVWTADAAHQIGQNEFQTFTLSVGPLPTAGTTIALPAAQGYTDGTTVNWADQEESVASPSASAGSDRESHPAPSFVTTAAAAPAAAAATPAAASATTSSDGGDTAGWFGLAAGLLGLAAGGTALARTRPVKGK